MKWFNRLFRRPVDELAEQRQRLRGLVAAIAKTELRNRTARAASYLERLQSQGVPFVPEARHEQQTAQQPKALRPVYVYETDKATGYPLVPTVRFEQDPLFGWLDAGFGALDGFYSGGLPLSAFPREMYPERPTTLRTQIAQDAIRFQSRLWYETLPFYSGPIGHLRNYVCGRGMTVDVVALEEEKTTYEQDDAEAIADAKTTADIESTINELLAYDIQEYLDNTAKFRRNRLHKRVRESALNLFRDGEDAIRVLPPPTPENGEEEVYPEIRNVDVSTIRGPHNEINGPWAYGVLTSWPKDFEDAKAYHLWYSDNTHEDVLPATLKLAKLDTTGANVKRGVPLAYKIRKQLPQMARLLDCMAVGEAARQAIPYLRQFNTADRAAVGAATPSWIDAHDAARAEYDAMTGESGDEIRPGEVPLINRGQEFVNPPQGYADSGTGAYRTLAETVACALTVPLWFITGTADQENYASSLVSESPLTKTIENAQDILTEHYREVNEAVVDVGAALGKFPVDWRKRVEIHCELPSPVARDPDKAVDTDTKLLDKGLLSPQHLCARNNLDFDEERDLTQQAELSGWKKPQPVVPGLPGDEPDNEPGDNEPPKPEE
jgi:hypothetical protein